MSHNSIALVPSMGSLPYRKSGESNRRYLCLVGDIARGHYIEQKRLIEMKVEMQRFMQQLADKISIDNGGALIIVNGALSSTCGHSFCNGLTVSPDESIAGTGKTEGSLKLADANAINMYLKTMLYKCKQSLHGEWPKSGFNEIVIFGIISVSGSDTTKVVDYVQDLAVKKGKLAPGQMKH